VAFKSASSIPHFRFSLIIQLCSSLGAMKLDEDSRMLPRPIGYERNAIIKHRLMEELDASRMYEWLGQPSQNSHLRMDDERLLVIMNPV
jgi:hypothetical protein